MTVVAEYVTKEHFDRTLDRYVTKDHFDKTIDRYVTKDHFDQAMEYLDRRFEVIIKMIDDLTQLVREDKRRIDTLETHTVEMKENHLALEEAEGKDAEASINHEYRIVRLEKPHKIFPDTPRHLLQPE